MNQMHMTLVDSRERAEAALWKAGLAPVARAPAKPDYRANPTRAAYDMQWRLEALTDYRSGRMPPMQVEQCERIPGWSWKLTKQDRENQRLIDQRRWEERQLDARLRDRASSLDTSKTGTNRVYC